jgi:hypothetical protein
MSIFPEYPKTSGSYVSQRRINKLKPIVIHILETKQPQILNAFKKLASRYSKMPRIELHVQDAIEKVRNARVTAGSDCMHGESDDYRIWIPKNKTNDTVLMGTLLHEALHYICTFNGKDICEKDEHYVMALLGDDC